MSEETSRGIWPDLYTLPVVRVPALMGVRVETRVRRPVQGGGGEGERSGISRCTYTRASRRTLQNRALVRRICDRCERNTRQRTHDGQLDHQWLGQPGRPRLAVSPSHIFYRTEHAHCCKSISQIFNFWSTWIIRQPPEYQRVQCNPIIQLYPRIRSNSLVFFRGKSTRNLLLTLHYVSINMSGVDLGS
jgi:hypothetical protein